MEGGGRKSLRASPSGPRAASCTRVNRPGASGRSVSVVISALCQYTVRKTLIFHQSQTLFADFVIRKKVVR